MVWLNPDTVTLDSTVLTHVTFAAIDREARRTAIEWTDLGAYPAFADVPEQRVTVRITRRVSASEPAPARPGDQVLFTLRSAPGASAAGVRVVSATVVITEIAHAWSSAAGLTQRITALALSPTGAEDPVTDTLQEAEI